MIRYTFIYRFCKNKFAGFESFVCNFDKVLYFETELICSYVKNFRIIYFPHAVALCTSCHEHLSSALSHFFYVSLGYLPCFVYHTCREYYVSAAGLIFHEHIVDACAAHHLIYCSSYISIFI